MRSTTGHMIAIGCLFATVAWGQTAEPSEAGNSSFREVESLGWSVRRPIRTTDRSTAVQRADREPHVAKESSQPGAVNTRHTSSWLNETSLSSDQQSGSIDPASVATMQSLFKRADSQPIKSSAGDESRSFEQWRDAFVDRSRATEESDSVVRTRFANRANQEPQVAVALWEHHVAVDGSVRPTSSEEEIEKLIKESQDPRLQLEFLVDEDEPPSRTPRKELNPRRKSDSTRQGKRGQSKNPKDTNQTLERILQRGQAGLEEQRRQRQRRQIDATGLVDPKPQPIVKGPRNYSTTLSDKLFDEEEKTDPHVEQEFCDYMWNCAGGRCQSTWSNVTRSWRRDIEVLWRGRCGNCSQYGCYGDCGGDGGFGVSRTTGTLVSRISGAGAPEAWGRVDLPPSLFAGRASEVWGGMQDLRCQMVRGGGVCTGVCGGQCANGCRIICEEAAASDIVAEGEPFWLQ